MLIERLILTSDNGRNTLGGSKNFRYVADTLPRLGSDLVPVPKPTDPHQTVK